MLDQWLGEVFSHPDPAGLLSIAAKTAIIYVFLVAGLRLLGKRELGQMTIYDFVLVVVLANSVQNAMVGDDTTLAGGLIAALTLLVLNRVISFALNLSPGLEHRLVGEPVLLVNNGHLLRSRMQREGITPEQLQAALREHGIASPSDARMCVLEVDGTISVVPKESTVHRTRHHFRGLKVT
jgi:uncharacterized membrane protein YcaP (DUF421 family)